MYFSLQLATLFMHYSTAKRLEYLPISHILTVELRCKLQEKLHRVTRPLCVD